MPLRIYMLLDRYLPIVGGAELQASALSQELIRRGHDVTIVTRRVRAVYPPQESIDGVPVRRLSPIGLGHLVNALMVGRMLTYLLIHNRSYDLIHVHGIGPLGLAALLSSSLTRRPVVLKVTTHGDLLRIDPPGIRTHPYSRFVRNIFLPRWLWGKILRQAGAIVATSEETQAEAASLCLSDRVTRIPNGVNLERFAATSEEIRMERRQQLNLPLDAKVIFFSGRLVYRKRIDTVLRALPRVLTRYPETLFLIAGSGELQQDATSQDLHRLIEELHIGGRVQFLGLCTNIEEYLQASNVFVLPSEKEGLPNVVLEAMAVQVPVIGTAIGGITDLIDSQTGWIIPVGDDTALAAALLEVFDNPHEANERASSARKLIEEHYSLSIVATLYEAVYARLLPVAINNH